ncbi:MAG TPA: DUF6597 domain-containing transcriptional factor [Gemmatimonadaceae bacterium]|nr:DUF6597 domain-containing transcriptional factor [Gemmatimonadaceae bacterium]
MRAANQRLYVHSATESILWPPPDRSARAYEQLAPPPALAGHVASIHPGYERIPPGSPIEERVLPDGSVRLLFNLGEPPAVIGGGAAHATEALGARCEPEVIRMAGALEQAGVQLRAGSVAALLGVLAGALAGGGA